MLVSGILSLLLKGLWDTSRFLGSCLRVCRLAGSVALGVAAVTVVLILRQDRTRRPGGGIAGHRARLPHTRLASLVLALLDVRKRWKRLSLLR